MAIINFIDTFGQLINIIRRAKRSAAREQGWSLVELLVTVVIIGALAGTATWLLVGLTTVSSDTSQRLRQYTSAEQISGFLNSRLSLARSSSLGTNITGAPITVSSPPLTTNAGVLPPSWAGDQLIFSVDQRCYRLLHIERLGQFWIAESSQCSALVNSQGLARGPNQQINGQWQFSTASPVYDPVIDRILANQEAAGGVRHFLLAEGIAGGQEPIFSYYDVSDNQIAVDQSAALGSSNPIYQGSLGGESAASVFAIKLRINALGNPSRASNNQAVSNRLVETTIYPNQLCLQEGN